MFRSLGYKVALFGYTLSFGEISVNEYPNYKISLKVIRRLYSYLLIGLIVILVMAFFYLTGFNIPIYIRIPLIIIFGFATFYQLGTIKEISFRKDAGFMESITTHWGFEQSNSIAFFDGIESILLVCKEIKKLGKINLSFIPSLWILIIATYDSNIEIDFGNSKDFKRLYSIGEMLSEITGKRFLIIGNK